MPDEFGEALELGQAASAAKTPFLRFGNTIDVRDEDDKDDSIFDAVEQTVERG